MPDSVFLPTVQERGNILPLRERLMVMDVDEGYVGQTVNLL